MTTSSRTTPSESAATGLWSKLTGANARAKIIAGVILLLLWQVGVVLFAPPFVAKPVNVVLAFPTVMVDPEFWTATSGTLFAVLQGLLIALVTGTALGVAMGRVKVFDRLFNVYLNGFYTLPMVAALPLITIWFGYESSARLATVIFAAFFPSPSMPGMVRGQFRRNISKSAGRIERVPGMSGATLPCSRRFPTLSPVSGWPPDARWWGR